MPSHNRFVLNLTDINNNVHNVHVSMFDYELFFFMLLVIFLFMSTSIEMQLCVVIVNIMFNSMGPILSLSLLCY